MKKAFLAFAGVSTLLLSSVASAVGFEGSIAFSSTAGWRPIDSLGVDTTIPAATGIRVITPGVGPYAGYEFSVSFGEIYGDFVAYFVGGEGGNMVSSFQFSDTGIDPFWTLVSGGTNFKFVMDSIGVDEQDANSLVLFGFGTLYVDGFDPTSGRWDFTGNLTGSAFSWSASHTSVPEPATLGLLGLGLLGLGVARRRKAA